MPNPVAYNATTPPSGGFQRATITYGLSGSNYGANSPGGLTYYNSLPTSSAWVIVSDSYTLGLSTQGNAKPVMWSTGSASTGSLIRLINGLPSMTSSFTDYYSAVNWLQSTNKYFLLNNGYENIVTDGLVLNLDAGWWNSYPTTGTTWTDLSGNTNNGTLTNGFTFNSSNNGSIVFDGLDAYVNVNSNANILSKTAYTKTAWFYPTSFSINNNINSGGFSGQHAFWLAGSDRLHSGHNGNWGTVVSTTVLSLNTWYFGAVTFDTTNGWKLYLNGTQESTSSSTTTFEGNGEILIGSYAGGNLFRGRIAGTQVYSKVLTASEVAQNYNALRGRYGI